MKNLYSKLLTFTALLLFSPCLLQAQEVFEDWVSYRGTQNYFLKSIVKTDANKNVYQAGATINEDGNYDVIVTKYNSSGVEQWTKTYDGNGGNDAGVDIYIDASDNVYVAGTTYDTANNVYKVLVLKYNSGGTLQWDDEYLHSGSMYNVATSITSNGTNIFIGGGTYNLQSETNYLALSYSSTGTLNWNYSWDNVGLNDVVTHVYMLSGDLILAGGTEIDPVKWEYGLIKLNTTFGTYITQQISGGDADGITVVRDLKRDDAGNIYVTGGVVNQNSGYDFRTLKLDDDLNILWSKTFNSGGSFDDIANGLEVDNSGNVYVAGYVQTASNGTDYTTIKYNSSGTQQWIRTYNGSANGADTAKSVILDGSQNLIVTGVTHNGANEDFYTVKYAPNGDEIWHIEYNSLENGNDNPFNMAIDDDGELIVGGQSLYNGVYTYTAVKYREADVTNPFGNTTPAGESGFTANRGQLRDLDTNAVNHIKYYSWDGNARVFLSDTARSYMLELVNNDTLTLDTFCRFDIKPFLGNSTRPIAKQRSQGFTNFYFPNVDNGRERVHNYKTIMYPEVWDDTDLTLTTNAAGTNYYYVLKKGAAKGDLKLQFNGHQSLSVDVNTGDLLVGTACGTHTIPAASAYQLDANGNVISLGWTPTYIISGNYVTFNIGTYNTNLSLVIAMEKAGGGGYDEVGLCWSTYFSGFGSVEGQGIIYDPEDKVIGSANVGAGNFVFASEISVSEYNSAADAACVFKLFEDHEVNWMTMYGGSSGGTYVSDIAQNSMEQVYCIGSTSADDLHQPEAMGASVYSYSGSGAGGGNPFDVVIFKLDSEDGEMDWSTYLGDSNGNNYGNDHGSNIVVMPDDKIYITGQASGPNFPHTSSSNSHNGGQDVFLCEFNQNDLLTWTYFLGGSGFERPFGLAADEESNIWIQGATYSSNFETENPSPSDPNVFFNGTRSGIGDDFISKISPSTQSVVYSTYYGGSSTESGIGASSLVHTDHLTTGRFNRVYVTGVTKSNGSSFPIMSTAFGSFNYDQNDGFTNGYLIELDGDNYHQKWGSFMNDANNGDGSDAGNVANSIHMVTFSSDNPDYLLVVGSSFSPDELDHVGQFDTYSSGPIGDVDGFLYTFVAGGYNLYRSTFFGGVERDYVRDIAFSNFSQMAISGGITSNLTDEEFPLDNPGGDAMFTDNLMNSGQNGFFAEFCYGQATSIEEFGNLPDNANINLYPNPTNGEITAEGDFSGEISYTIYDLHGRHLIKKAINCGGKLTIDCSILEQGSYILEIRSKTDRYTSKVVKL